MSKAFPTEGGPDPRGGEERDWTVLAVESALSHFLCPRLGLRWAAHVLALLREPGALASRPLVVHALSLGGYTFAQMLLLMGQDLGRHGSVAQRLRGHIFDSLVVGSLDRMALGECAGASVRGRRGHTSQAGLQIDGQVC